MRMKEACVPPHNNVRSSEVCRTGQEVTAEGLLKPILPIQPHILAINKTHGYSNQNCIFKKQRPECFLFKSEVALNIWKKNLFHKQLSRQLYTKNIQDFRSTSVGRCSNHQACSADITPDHLPGSSFSHPASTHATV